MCAHVFAIACRLARKIGAMSLECSTHNTSATCSSDTANNCAWVEESSKCTLKKDMSGVLACPGTKVQLPAEHSNRLGQVFNLCTGCIRLVMYCYMTSIAICLYCTVQASAWTWVLVCSAWGDCALFSVRVLVASKDPDTTL